jgi:hypothetical protein
MRFLHLDHIELVSGTWLHVLFQIKKNLKLITISFMPSDPFFDGLRGDGSDYEDVIFLSHALGDIQRQTNVNRIAAGLKPWTNKTYWYLRCPPLEVAMERGSYEELSSRNWDAEDSRT